MIHYITRLNIITGLSLFSLFFPELIFSQPQKGKVLSSETNSGIGFVNVGIINKNIGTVTDESGNFTIDLANNYDNDSLRFSMIGYESKSFLVGQFKEDSVKNVYLKTRSYKLTEVRVIYHRPKELIIGTPVFTNELRSGFAYNDLGSELGIKVNLKKPVKLKDINLNVAICTYDSVTYRLNLYQEVNETEYKNILTEPIYISFTKDKIKNVITFDLRKYSIIIEGDVLITLELYKDLGEGRLLFRTEFFTGSTYHRKTSEGTWVDASGVIGMYLHGQLIR
ncbi:MAG: carboxypeptidase-like regulatory domain-containing protein [Bacteroidales bacterium]|nr:carboxypeptidase-like regulatory domain-containing protein [Bacteroidales bacterium]